MSRREEILYPLVVAVVVFGIGAALFISVARGGSSDAYPLDKACYSVFDRNGVEHKSWYPPVPAADGGIIVSFNNDKTWGYVFGPSAMVVNRDCLRERGVDVPPLDGSDDGR